MMIMRALLQIVVAVVSLVAAALMGLITLYLFVLRASAPEVMWIMKAFREAFDEEVLLSLHDRNKCPMCGCFLAGRDDGAHCQRCGFRSNRPDTEVSSD